MNGLIILIVLLSALHGLQLSSLEGTIICKLALYSKCTYMPYIFHIKYAFYHIIEYTIMYY